MLDPARYRLALAALLLLLLPGCRRATNQSGPEGIPQFVSVGTAEVGGAFYNVGAAIADVLDEGEKTGGWRQATAESTAGSLENLRRLEAKDIQVGMANSSITYFAVRGEKGFDQKYEVKSIMTLFPLVAMFVTREGSGVETMADLKGRRVVVGPEGAGFEYFVGPILEAHGLSYDDFEAVNAGFNTAVGYLQDENVQAAFLGGGMKSPAITNAATTMDVHLIPFDEPSRRRLVADLPSFNEVTVPAGTYKGQDEPFDGLNVGSAHLIVRSDADEEFVYRVTKIIYEGREKIAQTHAAGKSINAQNVVRKTGVEFHPGAIKYYREIGIWKEDGAEEKSKTEPASKPAHKSDGNGDGGDADSAVEKPAPGDAEKKEPDTGKDAPTEKSAGTPPEPESDAELGARAASEKAN